jgi:pyruvate dehydrogenase complex dehydrogenase (E1) component
VRGNGKIIQELEAVFRGAGWNVIKVIWGSKWDELLARDTSGVLLNKMNTTVDGEFQRYTVEDGNYIRENFFGPDPRLREMVSHLSDDELRTLPRASCTRRSARQVRTSGRAVRRRSSARPSRAGRSDTRSRVATPRTRSRR